MASRDIRRVGRADTRPPHARRPSPQAQISPHPLVLQRAVTDPYSATPADIALLQSRYGNRAVLGLLARSNQRQARANGNTRFPIQASLTVAPANDQYEQEADRIARQVVTKLDQPENSTGVNFNADYDSALEFVDKYETAAGGRQALARVHPGRRSRRKSWIR